MHLSRSESLVDLFGSVARENSESISVAGGGESITYGELDRRSDGLARRIRALAPGGPVFVGVVADRSPGSVVGMMAILKAGHAYVPLDPYYPLERLHYLLDDAQVSLVVGPRDITESFAPQHLGVLDPREIPREAAPEAAPEETAGVSDVRIAGSDPAYMIYTSGSTGNPKGCVVTHANVLSMLRAALPLFDVSADDRWSIFHSMSFDFSVWELWGAFAKGGRATLVPADATQTPEAFIDFLAAEKITVLNQVPSVFRHLAKAHAERPAALPALRHIIFGGEKVDLDCVRRFSLSCGNRAPEFTNMYGITEITVHATFKRLTDADFESGISSPIGRPLSNLSISIRDEHGVELPPGETGEMWITGDGVARGYHRRPDTTQKSFVRLSDEFTGTRYYRSGDLARALPGGEFEYVGRADQQVKVMGFRIELGEIEEVLKRHPYVEDAVVALVPDRTGAKSLVACFVRRIEDDQQVIRELRSYASSKLPRHMAPNRFRAFDEFPLNNSGKTDRKALMATFH
ncbi:amino acid adenylation domain-containing protein [Kitasatospora sp. MAP5-34]|uniref:amino acid adenylation domain-containing protein n=1 Tax=Kitasatospora sp. MAP5-34 TaxID=3035102 RepID=UPI002475C749|nr:amino acid adenylation domain-containing protein [Kitasatospora sp. MAP5-34]MDH6578198.1 amino acid adenylation domain-containing protein [Kitasatospora sp. MAP5-34]